VSGEEGKGREGRIGEGKGGEEDFQAFLQFQTCHYTIACHSSGNDRYAASSLPRVVYET